MKKVVKKWTHDEDEQLLYLIEKGMSKDFIAFILNRSEDAVERRYLILTERYDFKKYRKNSNNKFYATKLDEPNRTNRYTPYECCFIMNSFLSDKQIAEILGRSVRAIEIKRAKLKKAGFVPSVEANMAYTSNMFNDDIEEAKKVIRELKNGSLNKIYRHLNTAKIIAPIEINGRTKCPRCKGTVSMQGTSMMEPGVNYCKYCGQHLKERMVRYE